MQAIILAAGMGKRLKELTKNATKCMVEVNGVTLIQRALNALDQLSLDRIVLVVGYEGKKLQEIINEEGNDAFLVHERDALVALDVTDTVVATGGSAIYSPEAMAHLKEIGTVVYLKVSEPEIERRLADFAARGVAIKDGMTVADLYNERMPLYEKYADITINEDGTDIPAVVGKIAEALARR